MKETENQIPGFNSTKFKQELARQFTPIRRYVKNQLSNWKKVSLYALRADPDGSYGYPNRRLDWAYRQNHWLVGNNEHLTGNNFKNDFVDVFNCDIDNVDSFYIYIDLLNGELKVKDLFKYQKATCIDLINLIKIPHWTTLLDSQKVLSALEKLVIIENHSNEVQCLSNYKLSKREFLKWKNEAEQELIKKGKVTTYFSNPSAHSCYD